MSTHKIGGSLILMLPIGFRDPMTRLGYELVWRKRHLIGLLKSRRYRGQSGIKLHLGCGNQRKPGWLNVDLDRAADLTLDLRERLPFDDNTFSQIYSEHFYEHFDYPGDITRLLSECFRVLQPGAMHSFAVPDGEMVLRHYTTREYIEQDEAQIRFNPRWCRTQMDHVNYCLRQNGEHRWYYDEETMRLLLQQVGFVDVRRREFDPELDQEDRRPGSMYMKCSKPKSEAQSEPVVDTAGISSQL